ncbi:mitochondrial distribution and morphology protein 10 [Heliocybe sulcata]|uniref:Mitochondrial distribution and morphology protein 10 n=1 Tax=Heliocybe sulcata TaxID=5364 RepID=A0A5C3NG31_9AGAM|nr:mitochondrial distribution and morphology protein 10 [Heliocybe sulcata]
MHPFASYVLRSYYKSTGWNEDNLYSNFTRSSSSILDFTVPRGLHFSISKSPNALFKTTYSMNALPSLNGSIGYIFTSCDLNVKGSGDVKFKDIVDRFKIYDQPQRPEGKEEAWQAGERVDTRDYLLYGRFYIPTGRLDALYSTRLSATLQGMVAAISDPRAPPVAASNLMLSLQHDTGRTCTEYTWSADDSMWGIRFLYNFGKLVLPPDHSTEVYPTEVELSSAVPQASQSEVKRVDEEEAMEGGLKGRISAGAEVYFSAREKSAGVSTGIRFTTLPDATAPSFQLPGPSSSPLALSSSRTPPQPPTTITALFNPIIGHISGAYAAKVSHDLSVCSRFDFNVYSYESEWTMGAEWWLRRKPQPQNGDDTKTESDSIQADESPSVPLETWTEDVQGVVKARASTTTDISLMWEGRLRNMLVSLGIVSNLSSRSKPIKAVGLELAYFSSG